MIHLFNSRGRILFFPVKWANAVASWILGLHSPSGTIRVANTANPSESGGATVDVDMEVVSVKMKDRLSGHFTTKKEVEGTIEKSIDGSSLVARDRKILVNEDWLKEAIGETAATVDSSATISAVGSTASAGSATKAAPSDHVHALNTDSSLAFDTSGNLGAVFGTTSGTVAEGDHDHDADYADINHNHDNDYADIDHDHDNDYASKATVEGHESRISALESATPSGSAVTSVNGETGAVTLDADDVGALDSDDIGTTVQAHSSKLDDLDDLLNSDGTLPAAAVSDANCNSGGDCLAYFDANKQLAHLGNSGVTVSKANALAAAFGYTASGSGKKATLNYGGAGASAAPTTQKVVGFAANSETASLVDAAVFDSSYTMAANDIVATKSDGKMTGLSLGNGLEISSSKLAPKLKTDGGLQATSDGLSLKKKSSAYTSYGTFIEKVSTGDPYTVRYRVHLPKFDSNGLFLGFYTGTSSGTYFDIDVFPPGAE